MLAALSKLFYLTGKTAYRERAEALVIAFSGEINRNFFPLATLLNGIEVMTSAVQIVIVGDRQASDTRALIAAVRSLCLPNRILQVIAPEESLAETHPANGKGQSDGRATAYICHGPVCSLPLTEPAGLMTALDKPAPS